jgi:hypothetical protein
VGFVPLKYSLCLTDAIAGFIVYNTTAWITVGLNNCHKKHEPYKLYLYTKLHGVTSQEKSNVFSHRDENLRPQTKGSMFLRYFCERHGKG